MNQADRRCVFEELLPCSAAVRQMLPAVASQMIVLIYNLTDTFYVGMLNDPVQSSALSVAFPLFTALSAVSYLFGVGGGIVTAQALGRKDAGAAKRASAITLWTGTATALLLALGYAAGAPFLLRLCGATDENFRIVRGYALWVVLIGGPFTIVSNILANLIRSEGNASAASLGISLGGILNILLDPFFIFPRFLHLEAMGAGVATALSNMASCVFFLIYMLRYRHITMLSASPKFFKEVGAYLGRILASGTPSAAQHALAVVSVAALTKFTSHYAIEAVAALGIVKKMDQLPLFFSLGCGNGLLPLLAYNHTAGNRERCEKIFRFGCTVSVGFCTACFFIFELLAPQLVSLFIRDSVTVAYGAAFLRRMVVAMPMMAFCNAAVTLFQTTGRAAQSTIISVLRKGSLDIPFLYLLDRLFPLYGCMWVQPTVDTIALAVTLFFLYHNRKSEKGCGKLAT